MESSIWETNYIKVFHLIKNDDNADNSTGLVFGTKGSFRLSDKNLDNWYQLWNRAYKSNRIKNQDQREKWKVLLDLLYFNKNCREYEKLLKTGKCPSEESIVQKERNLALWFKDQSDPNKCLNNMKIDYIKSNYPSFFEGTL